MTRCEALQGLIDKYETLAIKLYKMQELDLARFYKNVAIGFKHRLLCLHQPELEEVLA